MRRMTPNAILIDKKDSVVTAVKDIAAGDAVIAKDYCGEELLAKEPIPRGFKAALSYIPKGAFIYKYGKPVGVATQDIEAGKVVHVHNIRSNRGKEYREEHK
jgi:altronate dehydratase small subunit